MSALRGRRARVTVLCAVAPAVGAIAVAAAAHRGDPAPLPPARASAGPSTALAP